jgi:hypothetical protein
LVETPVAEKGEEAASNKKPGEEGAAEGAVDKEKQESGDVKEEGGVGGGVQVMQEGNVLLAEKLTPEASKNVDEVSLWQAAGSFGRQSLPKEPAAFCVSVL